MELIRTNWMIGSVGAGIWTASRARAEPGADRVVGTAVAQIISTAAVLTRRWVPGPGHSPLSTLLLLLGEFMYMTSTN